MKPSKPLPILTFRRSHACLGNCAPISSEGSLPITCSNTEHDFAELTMRKTYETCRTVKSNVDWIAVTSLKTNKPNKLGCPIGSIGVLKTNISTMYHPLL